MHPVHTEGVLHDPERIESAEMEIRKGVSYPTVVGSTAKGRLLVVA